MMPGGVMSTFAPYYKAIVGAIVAGLTAIVTGLEDGGLSTSEWLTAIIAFLVAGSAVFTVPNIKSNYPAK